jgi:hypothetical protein
MLRKKTICVQFENGNPLAKLPVDIQLRGRQVFSSVLKYAYELLTLDTMMKVPRSGIRCLFDPWIRDPDHISGELRKFFWVKILKFFDAESRSGKEKIRIRNPG